MSVALTLSPDDLHMGAGIGVLRHINALREGRHPAYGLKPGDERAWFFHILGACGELVVAKHFGIYWTANEGVGADDVGPLEVRTRSKDHYDLMVHDRDRDDAAFVLVTGKPPWLTIRGWMFGRDAKDRRYWADPAKGRPAYFVPQAELRPLAELDPLLRGAAASHELTGHEPLPF